MKVVNIAKLEEQRLNHLMNLEKDNYLDAEVDDNANGGDEGSDGSDDDGRAKKRGRSNSVGGIASRAKFPFRKAKAVSRENAKNFAQVLEVEDYKQYMIHVPTYLTIAVRASARPARKFSKMSGHLAPYTDPETGTRYASMREYASLKEKAQ